MRLDNHLFLEKYIPKGKPIGIFVGRMSPPTVAHQRIIQDAQRRYSQVYVFIIEGEKTKGLPKNFLTFEDRIDILKVTNPQARPILARQAYLPDVISDNKIPTDNGIVIIAGSDRIREYINQFKEVEYIVVADEIPRSVEDVSASKVRKALEDDDYYSYSRMIAKGLDNRRYFDLLKKAFHIKKMSAIESFKLTDLPEMMLEDLNTHMTHFEDNILRGDDGIKQNIQVAEDLRDAMAGDSISNAKVTVKWDGAPAIVFGYNPENNKFFVSTKSIFNKTPKIAYTLADVDSLFGHAPGLAEKLKIGLKYLPEIKPKGIFQGDFLFSADDLKTEMVAGEKCITFNPNTIVYAVPVNDTELANDIKRAKMGLVVHTEYTGMIPKLSASFNVKADDFTNTPNVWLRDAFIKDYSGLVNFTDKELAQVNGVMQAIMKTKVDFAVMKKYDLKELIMQFRNDRIRLGWGVISSNVMLDEFIKYLDELKNKGKMKPDAIDTLTKVLRGKINVMRNLFNVYNWMIKLKMLFIRKFEQIGSMGTFLKGSDGYKVTAPEGFCAINNDGQILKLVDRLEFSRANFLGGKFNK